MIAGTERRNAGTVTAWVVRQSCDCRDCNCLGCEAELRLPGLRGRTAAAWAVKRSWKLRKRKAEP